MKPKITLTQLESMTTHELADLLANVVMLLRRLPDVECRSLETRPEVAPPPKLPELARAAVQTSPRASLFTAADLKRQTLPVLKQMAHELHIAFPAKIKKDELIQKILSRSPDGHSEQFAIQYL